MFHSGGADVRQVEQPLALLRLLRPVYVQGDGVRQALPQIDDLKMETRAASFLRRRCGANDQTNARAATEGWICSEDEGSVLTLNWCVMALPISLSVFMAESLLTSPEK